MIAARVVVPRPKEDTGNNAMIIYKGKHVLKPYTKKDLLKALCLYSKWHYNKAVPSPLSMLFKLRCVFGTQFLIDLFILTEVYIDHWPCFAMHLTRANITHILNQCPDFRILYEE